VKYKGKSIFDWGDISTCSFHATKIFHTGEGGAAFVNNEELYDKVFYSHNFGHNGPTDFHSVGINGKMSELQAAMGLAVIPCMNRIIEKRGEIYQKYLSKIEDYQFIQIRTEIDWNYHYVPMLTRTNQDMELFLQMMTREQIAPRRYFYPSLNTLKYVDSKYCENSERISSQIVCLPIYDKLEVNEQARIINILNRC
jgi:dTDP-4-amino-4,6-dideoxygalactose transaminase